MTSDTSQLLKNMPWGKYCVLGSLVFRAACSEAADPAMRPLDEGVLSWIADQFHQDQSYAQTGPLEKQLRSIFDELWIRAASGATPDSQELRFAKLLAEDIHWKSVVSDAVVAERLSISRLLLDKPMNLSDRLVSFVKKLLSPDHPAGQRILSTFVILSSAILVVNIPPIKADLRAVVSFVFSDLKVQMQPPEKLPNIQVEMKKPPTLPNILVELKPSPSFPKIQMLASSANVNKDGGTVIVSTPKQEELSLKITPYLDYPSDKTGLGKSPISSQQGLPVHFVPDGDIYLISKQSPDGKLRVPLEVSVDELRTEDPTTVGAAINSGTANGSLQTGSAPEKRSDQNVHNVETKNMAALVQSQIQNQGAAWNQAQTKIVAVRPNSAHSIVLQWFAEKPAPETCTLTFNAREVTGTQVHLTGIKSECLTLRGALQVPNADDLRLSTGGTAPFQPWLLSVDEIHQQRFFSHEATLRLTWQPAAPQDKRLIVGAGPATQMPQTSPDRRIASDQ